MTQPGKRPAAKVKPKPVAKEAKAPTSPRKKSRVVDLEQVSDDDDSEGDPARSAAGGGADDHDGIKPTDWPRDFRWRYTYALERSDSLTPLGACFGSRGTTKVLSQLYLPPKARVASREHTMSTKAMGKALAKLMTTPISTMCAEASTISRRRQLPCSRPSRHPSHP